MAHHHDHGHAHHHTTNKRVLFWSFIAIFTFMIVEAIGGYITNSLALLSDAGHMLSDAFSLALSLFAFKLGEKRATKDKTYGFKRFEIIAAFINGLTLIVIALFIFYEAYTRFLEPPNVSASMMFIAIIGLVVNVIVAFMLMQGGSQENLNIRGALLHVMGDLLGSVGAIVAGILIYAFGWNLADPLASVIVAVLILFSAIRLTKESIHVLMEGKPYDINADEVKHTLENLNGVVDVHDLHIWAITAEFPSLSCHLVVEQGVDRDQLLMEANEKMKNMYHISHCTVQIEGFCTDNQENCGACH